MLKIYALMALLISSAVPSAPDHTHALPPGYQQVQLNGQTFTLPENLQVELIASSPLVDRPVHADFDEQGRLYVADSSGSNEKLVEQAKNPEGRIVRLEDTNSDGIFDKSILFADKVMFPEGAMWFEGSFYVAAPPSIWKFTDTDNDGQADQRSEWFNGKTLTGCGNDLHGPYRGPDGWIYWCKGAFAEQTYDRPGNTPFVTRAAHVFRCRPDGSGIEPVMTGGMDNPVELAFTPGGERIFTTTFFMHPAGGQRDGMVHAIYGGVYGKIHDVIQGHPRTGEIMPVLTHFGPAAPAGLACSQSAALGEEFKGALYSAQFSLHRIGRHRLIPDGASFKTEDSDLLLSSHIDFHPTDVLEDADGSLIVLDTGAWYKLCCPSSQLSKPDVLGGIYRVRPKAAQPVDDPRGLKIPFDQLTSQRNELAKLLEDSRTAVADRAGWELSKIGPDAVPALEDLLQSSRSVDARRRAVWALCRIPGSAARQAGLRALKDADESVRQTAIHAISIHRDSNAVVALEQVLNKSTSLHNRRAAAEALGRLEIPAVVPLLLSAAGSSLDDRILEHSITYALIELARPDLTREGLASTNPRVFRTALIALDQMPGGNIDPALVASLLISNEPLLKQTALWLVGRHSEWGTQLASFLQTRLFADASTTTEQSELIQLLPKFSKDQQVQQLMANAVGHTRLAAPQQIELLRTFALSGLGSLPESWIAPLVQSLLSPDADLSAAAVSAARAFAGDKPLPETLQAALIKKAEDTVAPNSVRIEALSAAATGLPGIEPPIFDLLLQHLTSETPVTLRLTVADILSRIPLKSEQLQVLAKSVASASPLEIERLITTFKQSTDPAVGQQLIEALKIAPALPALRKEFLETILTPYGESLRQAAEPVFTLLEEQTKQQRERLELLLTNLKDGDVRRGHEVFNSTKAACFSCHAIGYRGGNVGPDLTRIGQIRNERDLLESIVFPSASFVRSFEPVVVATVEGKVINGILKSNNPEEVVLRINAIEDVRIPRERIEEMNPGTVSVMPAGLEQQLSPQDLADLVAFLRAAK